VFFRPCRSVRLLAVEAIFGPDGRLEQVLPSHQPPAEQAALADQALWDRHHGHAVVHALLVEIDLAHDTVVAVHAGSPIVLRRRGHEVDLLDLGRSHEPLGLLDRTRYEAGAVDVRPGDALLLLSDGVAAVRSGDDELGTLDGLAHRLAHSSAPRDLPSWLVADLRAAGECDRVVAETGARFGGVDILVNNAGLTFTYIDPARFRRSATQRFWEVTDEIVDNVIATNYLAGDRLARRVAPALVAQGWGRIVNVTTKLDTMNRLGTHPYGASKAALELATEVWAKAVEGTGAAETAVLRLSTRGAQALTSLLRAQLRAPVTPRINVLMLNTPSNPTGTVPTTSSHARRTSGS